MKAKTSLPEHACSSLQVKFAGLRVFRFQLLNLVKFKTPDSQYLRLRRIFIVNTFKDPTFVLN